MINFQIVHFSDETAAIFDEENNECAACLGKMESNQSIVAHLHPIEADTLVHHIHQFCLQQWKKKNCPLCRADYRGITGVINEFQGRAQVLSPVLWMGLMVVTISVSQIINEINDQPSLEKLSNLVCVIAISAMAAEIFKKWISHHRQANG